MKGPDLDAVLNDALLAEPAAEEAPEQPRRNSKEDLIKKIVRLCEEAQVPLDHTNTKLKRMTKKELTQLLAKKTQDVIRNQMAEQAGVQRGSADSIIALGALRMVHNLCAVGTEKGINTVLPGYGYELEGFAEGLKKPGVSEAVDDCLREIAATTDVLSYIESPYARLALAWGGVAVGCVQRCLPPTNNKRGIPKRQFTQNATRLGPRPPPPKNSFQRSPCGGTSPRKEHGGFRPPTADAKLV